MVKLGMLHLEYGFDQEAFRVPVVADHPEHFAYDAAARLTLDMSPKIDGLSDLCFGVGEGGLRMIADNQIGEAMEGLFRGVGMDRGQRSGVAVLKESSSVRPSIPRTSPRMIRSGRQRKADFKRSSKEILALKVSLDVQKASRLDSW